MTKIPNCCGPTTGVRVAAAMLRQFNLGILVVVDDLTTRKVMGVVTDRDLCLRVLGETHDGENMTVQECMTRNTACCRLEADVRDVLALMAKRQVRRIPVVSADNKVEGIVSLADLIRHGAVSPRDLFMALQRITAPKRRGQARAAAAG